MKTESSGCWPMAIFPSDSANIYLKTFICQHKCSIQQAMTYPSDLEELCVSELITFIISRTWKRSVSQYDTVDIAGMLLGNDGLTVLPTAVLPERPSIQISFSFGVERSIR